MIFALECCIIALVMSFALGTALGLQDTTILPCLFVLVGIAKGFDIILFNPASASDSISRTSIAMAFATSAILGFIAGNKLGGRVRKHYPRD